MAWIYGLGRWSNPSAPRAATCNSSAFRTARSHSCEGHQLQLTCKITQRFRSHTSPLRGRWWISEECCSRFRRWAMYETSSNRNRSAVLFSDLPLHCAHEVVGVICSAWASGVTLCALASTTRSYCVLVALLNVVGNIVHFRLLTGSRSSRRCPHLHWHPNFVIPFEISDRCTDTCNAIQSIKHSSDTENIWIHDEFCTIHSQVPDPLSISCEAIHIKSQCCLTHNLFFYHTFIFDGQI